MAASPTPHLTHVVLSSLNTSCCVPYSRRDAGLLNIVSWCMACWIPFVCCMPAVTRTVTPFKQGVPSGVQHSEQVVMRQLKTVYRSQAQALQQHAGRPVVCSGELPSPALCLALRALVKHAGRPVVCSGTLSEIGFAPGHLASMSVALARGGQREKHCSSMLGAH